MIKNYKSSIRKNLKRKQQDIHKVIAEKLDKEGIVEVLAGIYTELYLLKKQLMSKGTIEPEQAYLIGEIYEYLNDGGKSSQ